MKQQKYNKAFKKTQPFLQEEALKRLIKKAENEELKNGLTKELKEYKNERIKQLEEVQLSNLERFNKFFTDIKE